ncbi:MAG: hypothetical protein CMJ88_13900 [Planctomycetes bacterium]|nr:hypothetical protein [Planctomycetota bacterium]
MVQVEEMVLRVDWIVVISLVYPSMIFSYLVISVLTPVISLSMLVLSSAVTLVSLVVRISSLVLKSVSSETAVTLRVFFSFSFLVHLVVSSSYLIF